MNQLNTLSWLRSKTRYLQAPDGCLATTEAGFHMMDGTPAIDFFATMGAGSFMQGIINCWKLARQYAPLTNLWYTTFSHATINGTNSLTIKFYTPVLLAYLNCRTTDLDSTSIAFKINDREVQFSGSSSEAGTSAIPSKDWSAFDNVPVLLALDKDDDLTIKFTDTGVQTIVGVLVGYLLPPRQVASGSNIG